MHEIYVKSITKLSYHSRTKMEIAVLENINYNENY